MRAGVVNVEEESSHFYPNAQAFPRDLHAPKTACVHDCPASLHMTPLPCTHTFSLSLIDTHTSIGQPHVGVMGCMMQEREWEESEKALLSLHGENRGGHS